MPKSPKMIIVAVLLVGLAIAGGFVAWKQVSDKKDDGLHVTNNGKDYKVEDLTTANESVETTQSTNTTNQQKIEQLEAKIASGQNVTHADYVALAQVYMIEGNNDKAIENYEKAKQVANPNMQYYDSFIKSMDDAINQLKGQ